MRDFTSQLKLMLYISFLMTSATSFASTHTFSSCEDAVKNNEISCEQSFSTELLPKPWKEFEKIVQEVGYDDAQNPDDQFFLDIRKELEKTVKANQTKMKFKKKCLELLEYPKEKRVVNVADFFSGLGVNSSTDSDMTDRCEVSIGFLRESIKKNFYLMQEGVNIGWSAITTVSPYSFVGITRDKDTKVSMIGIPVEKKGKGHVLSIHEAKLDEIKQADLERINEKMYIELSEHIVDIDFGNSEQINDKDFLESIKSLPLKERIEKIKKRVQNYSPKSFVNNRKSSFNSGWDLNRKNKYQEQYFTAISKVPLIAHLPNGDGSTKDLLSAFDTFIENSDKFLERLKPNSEDPLKLKHLANFKPIINEYLKDYPNKCAIADSWMNSKKKEDSKAVKWQIGRVGALLTGCFGGAFLAETGIGAGVAAATCTAGSAALAGYDIHQANIERNQVAQEAELNATKLLARDFNDLNSAEKELYLNIALLPLELIGARAAVQGGKTAGRAFRGTATETDKALTRRGRKVAAKKLAHKGLISETDKLKNIEKLENLSEAYIENHSRIIFDKEYGVLLEEVPHKDSDFIRTVVLALEGKGKSKEEILKRIKDSMNKCVI